MYKDLHKRLEEAAEKAMPEVIRLNPVYIPSYRTGFERCGEWIFKEAIKVAKEWLETNIANQVEMVCAEGPLMMSKRTFLADFESEMLKLWEEYKRLVWTE